MTEAIFHRMRHLVGCAMALAFASSQASPPSDMYDRLTGINADTEEDKFSRLDAVYREGVSRAWARLESIEAAEVSRLFDATDLVAFYAQYESREALGHYVEHMGAAYAELARRSIASEQQANAMLDANLGARLFDEARALRDASPTLLRDRAVPAVVFAPGFRADDAAVLALQPDGSLLARNVDRSGAHLVVVVGCRPSQRAIEEINALPELVAALDRIPVFWLLPADRMTDPAFLREWNARFPRQPAMFAYANAAWKGVEFQSMPRFQRFEGEQRVAQLLGWKRGGGAAQLEPLL